MLIFPVFVVETDKEKNRNGRGTIDFPSGPTKSIDLAIADIISRFIPLSRVLHVKRKRKRVVASLIRGDLRHYFAYGPPLITDIHISSSSILRRGITILRVALLARFKDKLTNVEGNRIEGFQDGASLST